MLLVIVLIGLLAAAITAFAEWRLSSSRWETFRDIGVALLTGSILGLAIFLAEVDRDRDAERRAALADVVGQARTISASQPIDLETVNGRFLVRSLAGVDLTGGNLAGLDLSNTDLSGTILQSANLASTSFHAASLSGTDLSDARLTNADFSGATLRRTVFNGGSFLRGANFDGAVLHDLDLSHVVEVGQTGSNTWLDIECVGEVQFPSDFANLCE